EFPMTNDGRTTNDPITKAPGYRSHVVEGDILREFVISASSFVTVADFIRKRRHLEWYLFSELPRGYRGLLPYGGCRVSIFTWGLRAVTRPRCRAGGGDGDLQSVPAG